MHTVLSDLMSETFPNNFSSKPLRNWYENIPTKMTMASLLLSNGVFAAWSVILWVMEETNCLEINRIQSQLSLFLSRSLFPYF